MGSKKKISAWFKKEASKLPEETYQAFHRYSTIQYHQDGDTARPVYGEIGNHEVKHWRRLKRLFLKHGKEAVDQYFAKYNFKLQRIEDGYNKTSK